MRHVTEEYRSLHSSHHIFHWHLFSMIQILAQPPFTTFALTVLVRSSTRDTTTTRTSYTRKFFRRPLCVTYISFKTSSRYTLPLHAMADNAHKLALPFSMTWMTGSTRRCCILGDVNSKSFLSLHFYVLQPLSARHKL